MLVELGYYLKNLVIRLSQKRLAVINAYNLKIQMLITLVYKLGKVCDLLWSQTQQSFKHEVGVDTDLQHFNIVKFNIVTLV